MKVRNGFVSNSSSSSFILKKNCLTTEQLNAILHNDYKDQPYGGDGWNIEEIDGVIKGYTSMDNYDYSLFLEKIGVSLELVIFDDTW